MTPQGTASAARPLADKSLHAQWRYGQQTDPQVGRRTWCAEIEETKSGPQPPQAPGSGNLIVRGFSRFGTHTGVAVELARLPRAAVAGCRVLAQFDDRPPVLFQGRQPGEEAPGTLRLEPAEKFVALAARARRIRLTLPLAAACRQIEFHAGAPLVWPRQG